MSKSIISDEKAEIGYLLVLPMMIIISIMVVATFGSAVIPVSLTQASNLSASTATGGNGTAGNPYTGGYNSWSTGNQNIVSSVPTFINMNYLFVYVIILLTAIGIIVKVVG